MDSNGDALISRLESGDPAGLHGLFLAHLRPFAPFFSGDPKLKSNSKKQAADVRASSLRTLAKQFLPFVNRSLSTLKIRLSDPPQSQGQSAALELFDTFKLCLRCVDCISSQLECKPHALLSNRVWLIHCSLKWERYEDAEIEGFAVLERLKCIAATGTDASKGVAAKPVGQYLPHLAEDADPEFAFLLVEVVVTLARCVSTRQPDEAKAYWTVLALLNEVRPWFRVLDAKVYDKSHRMFVSCLHRCFVRMLGGLQHFERDLIHRFCSETMKEYTVSSMKDQALTFARRICSSIFSQQDNAHECIMDVLKCVLDSTAYACKVGDTMVAFMELVSYCATKCLSSNVDLCKPMAEHLNLMAVNVFQGLVPFGMILRLYAGGLYLTNGIVVTRVLDSTCSSISNGKSAVSSLLNNGDVLQDMSKLTSTLGSYFHISSLEKNVPHPAKYRNSVGVIYSPMNFNHEASVTCNQNGKDYLFCYLGALLFLCRPLSELVYSERKQILAEDEDFSISTGLCVVQATFNQFCNAFIFYHRCTTERQREELDMGRTALTVAVAAYTLSLKTKLNIQRSVKFIKHVISSEWIESRGLKFLSASLYSIGINLYKNKQLKEASKALKFCCRASWTCAENLSQQLVDKSKGSYSDLSEAAVVDFVNEASTRSAFFLDVMYKCGSCKLNKMMVNILEGWSAAGKSCKIMPSSATLVNQWVKINCNLHMDFDMEADNPTLFCMLSDSVGISNSLLGVIVEQELQAYEELNRLCPKFCLGMQMKIMNILLKDVYIEKHAFLKKSKILIRKARVLRAGGIEAIKDCIQCLSKAISIINDMCDQTNICKIAVSQQLAVAYSLRALCEQESEPNSKQFFDDIQAAVDIWLSLHVPDDFSSDDHCRMASGNILLLLYHMLDLLILKGCTKFHNDIYKLIIRLFKWKNVPPGKLFALLWKYRRLSHALCASPVNEAFIMNSSEQYGEISESLDFWRSCMKGSEQLVVAFQQNLSPMYNVVAQGSSFWGSFFSDISTNDVKKAALDLISSVPVSNHSVFLASHLYHDMCERLISNGQLTEALLYAKEAQKLRCVILHEMFSYEVQNLMNEEGGEKIFEKHSCGFCNFQISNSVATFVWSFQTIPWDSENFILTPWTVLQSYLESILQVGTIHEMLGNESDAEVLLLLGKNISQMQGLPIFAVSFSSALGKLYHNKWLWDLAEKELYSAQRFLTDDNEYISCSKCRLIFDATIDQQLADLYSSHCKSSGRSLLRSISDAENLYKQAIDKLNLSEWKNTVSFPEEINIGGTFLESNTVKVVEDDCNYVCSCHGAKNVRPFLSHNEVTQEKLETGRSRKSTRAMKKTGMQEHCLVAVDNVRMTRSRSRSSQVQSAGIPTGSKNGLTNYTKGTCVCAHTETANDYKTWPKNKKSFSDFGCEEACICMNTKCWHCLPLEVAKSGLVSNFIHLKWEFKRRQILLRLLPNLGESLGNRGETHEMHEMFLQSVCVLSSRNAFRHASYSDPHGFLLDLVGKEFPGDMLLAERAAVLYNISWFSLKNYYFKDTRIVCCRLSHIQLQRIVSWLLLAFTLCREIPLLFQKVSRLLVIVILYSTSTDPSSLSLSSCKALSANHWASYFHQASLGTHLNYQLFSSIRKHDSPSPIDAKGFQAARRSLFGEKTCNIPRIAPESFERMEDFISNFFDGLPCTTIICLSLLGDAYCGLLKDLMLCPSSVTAWMLISRMNSKHQPIVVLLPLNSVLEENLDDDASSWMESSRESWSLNNQWRCPWGSTIVDDVAPVFKLILAENYLSSSTLHLEDTIKNRSLWWARRKELDQKLGKMLRNLEDSWLGPWKHLLLGEWLDCNHLDAVNRKLVHALRSKCRMDVNEDILKFILGSGRFVFENQECVSELILKKGCYIGRGGGEASRNSNHTLNGVRNVSKVAFRLIIEAANELETEMLCREPVILVLDSDVQMLPWESIPILRDREVYRMPSIGSIFATIDTFCQQQELKRVPSVFPLIDPLDAFYLLNPSGDLNFTQDEFENWFRSHSLEGKAGTKPTAEELAAALESHDLFIYFGHGSGSQYIPGKEIQKLENCAATLLMGCSSGSLSVSGCYPPRGTPLHYLAAGSPVVVANLWEVTDKDIDRFAKAMLDAWMMERSNRSEDCTKCDSVTKGMESLNMNGSEGERTPNQKLIELSDSIECACDHRPKVGSFMSQSRESCVLRFLIGASPVCYGVPTGIWIKDS